MVRSSASSWIESLSKRRKCVVPCFVCRTLFGARTSQRSFSESGLTILSESVAIAYSITSSPLYAPWSVVESTCASQVITDLCACWDRVVLRRRTAKDTSERWYDGGTARSETASRPGVRTSDVVEEGRVECVPVAAPVPGPPGPSQIRSSPSKRKR